MINTPMPSFHVHGANQIESWLKQNPQRVVDIVRETYIAHHRGKTVNPDSYFLRFPNDNLNRIIALPSSLEHEDGLAGIKWIASFPKNIQQGLDRASALLLLNDRKTGYPFACLEGSLISAARTAASAVVGAGALHATPGKIGTLCIVGCGLIAFESLSLLVRTGWSIAQLHLIDLDPERSGAFAARSQMLLPNTNITHSREIDGLKNGDVILFATSAVSPTVTNADLFSHSPTVLHLSLRDLGVEIIRSAQNFADDIGHCLKANTSLDLAVRILGNNNFIAGDIGDLLEKRILLDFDRPRIYSPFGMGILDLAVGHAIHQELVEHSEEMSDFFPKPFGRQTLPAIT